MKMATPNRLNAGDFPEEVIDQLLFRSRGKLDGALKRIRRPQAAIGIVKSSLGHLLVAMTGRGIVLNRYLDDGSDLATTIAKLRLALDLVEDNRAIAEIGAEVSHYVSGRADALRRNVDLTLAVNGFQKDVLIGLQTVPRGALISYQALGAVVGSASSARAVGNALHNNPVPIYVPCHRVISSDGTVGGYGGGRARKLKLLHSEGFAVEGDSVAVSAVFGHTRTNIYCRHGCRTAARVDRARILFFADAQQAKRAGMRPCNVCRPDS